MGFAWASLCCKVAVVGLALASGVLSLTGAEQRPREPAPPRKTLSPEIQKLLRSFQIRSGFRIELAAAAPAVASPVALAFDENGRLWVCENPELLRGTDKRVSSGRLRILEDTDHDGVFDSTTLFADNLPFPSGIACYDGGVFIATAEEILFLKSNSERRVVVSGLNLPTNAPPPLPAVNSLQWGLNNRLYCCAAGLGAGLALPAMPGSTSAYLGQNDFSFDPKTRVLFAESGPSYSGETFDTAGRRIVCDPGHPARQSMYAPQYLSRNPFFVPPPALLDILAPAGQVFHFNTPANTRTNQPRGGAPITNLLRADIGTDARGLCAYRGFAFPSNFINNLFIPITSAHAIRRAIVRPNGLELLAERSPDERDREFLESRDESFNPVQVINAPDGALYVADFQSGGDSGRIFRIIPENFRQPTNAPQLGKDTTRNLVANLASPSGWHRETAARLLYERQDAAAVPLLTNMVQNSQLPWARLHALYSLASQNALTGAALLKGLRDGDEQVRATAVRLSEAVDRLKPLSDPVWAQLRAMASDHSIVVRYQVALTVGSIFRPERVNVLAATINRDPENRWFRFALMSGLIENGAAVLTALANNPLWRADIPHLEFLRQLAVMIGVQGHQAEAMALLDYLQNARLDSRASLYLCSGFGEGLRQAGSSLALVDRQHRLQNIYDNALEAAVNESLAPEMRIVALQTRAVSPVTYYGVDDLLQVVAGVSQTTNVLKAALLSLTASDTPGAFDNLLTQQGSLSAAGRHYLASAMLTRGFRMQEALAALQRGYLSPADFDSPELNLLRTFPDPALSLRAVKLLGQFQPARQDILLQLGRAAALSGDAGRGRAIFNARCASCHSLAGFGFALGPDLLARRAMGRQLLLASILQPSAEITPGYPTAIINSRESDVYFGVLQNENEASVTIARPNGETVVVPRANIELLQREPWSMMPDGLEQGLNQQSLADLLQFIMTAPWVRQ